MVENLNTANAHQFFHVGQYVGVLILFLLAAMMFLYAYRGLTDKSKTIASRLVQATWGGMLFIVLFIAGAGAFSFTLNYQSQVSASDAQSDDDVSKEVSVN